MDDDRFSGLSNHSIFDLMHSERSAISAMEEDLESIETEITKVESEMSNLKDKYDTLADSLNNLQERKRKITGEAILVAYSKSNKSYEEIMAFLKS